MKQILTIAIICMLCGCAREDTPTPSYPILFELGAELTGTVDSRAIINGTTLPVGDTIGLFGYSYTGTNSWPATPDLYDNEAAKVGTPDSNNRNTLTIATKEYTKDRHAFYAYYPYRNTVTASNTQIAGDLFDNDGQIDWLWSDPVIDLAATANPVRIRLKHKMTLLPILAAKTEEVGVELKLEQITIETTGRQSFVFDVSDGFITPGATGKTQYTIVPTDSTGAAFFVPDLATGDTLATATAAKLLLLPDSQIKAIALRVNGEAYRTPDDWTGFAAARAGEYRLLSIVMGISEITISIGMLPWDDGETTDFTNNQLIVWLGQQGWGHNPDDDTDLTSTSVTISIGQQGWGHNPDEDIDFTVDPGLGIGVGKQEWEDENPNTIPEIK